MKVIFVVADKVVAQGVSTDPNHSISCTIPEAVGYIIDENMTSDIGWDVVVEEGVVTGCTKPASTPPKVSPVEFMLLFTAMERVQIKGLRATDPVIDDFMDLIDDLRLTFVDLGIDSTKQALDYFISLSILTAERKTEILTGSFK